MGARRSWSRGTKLGLLAGALLLGFFLIPFVRLWRPERCQPFMAACPAPVGSDVYVLFGFHVLYASAAGYLTGRFLDRHDDLNLLVVLAFMAAALAFFGSIEWVILLAATW